MIRQRSHFPTSSPASGRKLRNRRNRRQFAVVLNRPAKVMAVLGILVIALVMVLCRMHNKSQSLGRQIAELEAQKRQLEIECSRERLNWAAMISPDKLHSAMLRHGIEMELPRSEQVARLAIDETKPIEYLPNEWAVFRAENAH
ncbi:MAG: hypothetical protein ACOX5G_02615 [Kiritimatiellia bacterium]|jgi:hypothetical protein